MNTEQKNISSHSIPSAIESIAACKSLFDESNTRKKLKKLWGNMPARFRGMICIAGDMKAAEFSRDFDSFDDEELGRIRNGMMQLKELVVMCDRNVGDVRQIKSYQLTRNH